MRSNIKKFSRFVVLTPTASFECRLEVGIQYIITSHWTQKSRSSRHNLITQSLKRAGWNSILHTAKDSAQWSSFGPTLLLLLRRRRFVYRNCVCINGHLFRPVISDVSLLAPINIFHCLHVILVLNNTRLLSGSSSQIYSFAFWAAVVVEGLSVHPKD